MMFFGGLFCFGIPVGVETFSKNFPLPGGGSFPPTSRIFLYPSKNLFAESEQETLAPVDRLFIARVTYFWPQPM